MEAFPMPSIPRICSIDNCNKRHKARGYCDTHYCRWKKRGTTDLKNRRHGISRTARYRAWASIIGRISSTAGKPYLYYGGRGIKMCQNWRDSVEQFYADIGERPDAGFSIDRIDNNGHYSCGKCKECIEEGWPLNIRWATKQQQMLNRRSPKNKTGFKGVKLVKNGKYASTIKYNRKSLHLGTFLTAKDAAQAYNNKAVELYGFDAILNVIP